MTPVLEWLLNLEQIRLRRDVPLMLTWDNPFEAWMWFGFAVVSLAWIGFLYRREQASLTRRTTLAVIRCAIVALAALVFCRPSLVLQRNLVERSHVAVLLDTSLSMAEVDHYRDEGSAQSVSAGAGLAGRSELAQRSRLTLIRAALLRQDAAPLRRLLERNAVQLCTFATALERRGSFTLPANLDDLVTAVSSVIADGASTDLPGAIQQVMAGAQGRRLAAIVLASDGRSTHPTNLKDVLDVARDRQIPVFALRIGSTEPLWDLELARPRTQERVFVNDLLAVEAQLTGRGLTEPALVTVRLVDQRADQVVASSQVLLEASTGATTVELRTKPRQPGQRRYRVEVVPVPGEATTENNAESLDVTVLEDRVRVLYVDGYPRYEYRYLKNALVREPTVELSVLLMEADEQFVQEGSDPIRRFPETPEELNRYDVVLFGDVDPRGGWLTHAQMNMLLDFVGNEGGGFGLIAGERASPHRFAGTPLAKLVPVRLDPGFFGHTDRPLGSGFQAELTAEGRRGGIFRFATDREDSERFFSQLPQLYWIARTLGPKPGASVLAEHPTLRTMAGPMPLIVTGRYGAGRLFFQATDDTWRWRRHTGEWLHDVYWVQVARSLVRSSRVGQDRRFTLRTDRRLYPYGCTVQTRVEVFEPRLLAEHPESVSVSVARPVAPSDLQRATNEARDTVEAADTVAARAVGEFRVFRLSPESNRFEGAWVPPGPGRFVLEALDMPPRPGDRPVSVLIRVERPDLETRRPEADHEVLARMAAATGGRVVDLDELSSAFGAIRDRSVQIPDDIVEPLWDSRLALLLFGFMVSMEWILRKAFGLT